MCFSFGKLFEIRDVKREAIYDKLGNWVLKGEIRTKYKRRRKSDIEVKKGISEQKYIQMGMGRISSFMKYFTPLYWC